MTKVDVSKVDWTPTFDLVVKWISQRLWRGRCIYESKWIGILIAKWQKMATVYVSKVDWRTTFDFT